MILYLVFISLMTFAHENCGEIHTDSQVHNLEVFSKDLEHWSANDQQVMSAPCKHKAFHTDEMNLELSTLVGKKDKKIRGVKFQDENPELLNAFRKLTQKSDSSWLERLFPQLSTKSNLQKTYSVNPECEKVLCAVDKIWGPYLGRKLLYLNYKFGYNGSELSHKNSQRLNESELDDVLISLSDLPKSFMPMGKGRPLVKHAPDSEHPDKGPDVWADSEIRLYSPWFSGSQPMRFQAMVHELGHHLHEQLPPEKYQEWLSLSSWVKLGEKWEFDSIDACLVSKYSMLSPMEDFAETAAAYRYNGKALLAQCPQKYSFMKDIYKGTEYREESHCSGK